MNSKLGAAVKIHWDQWSSGDPENGPYPDISTAVETSSTFVPRSFLKDVVVQKLSRTYPGLLAGKTVTRGYILKFKDVASARACLSDLTETTNLLPFFCGPDGHPVQPADTDLQAGQSAGGDGSIIGQETQRIAGGGAAGGDIDQGRQSTIASGAAVGGTHNQEKGSTIAGGNAVGGAIDQSVTGGMEEASQSSTFWLAPIGDELSVVLDFLLSFYGWKRIYCTGSDVVGVECASPAAALRMMKYINENTPAQAWPTRADEQLPVTPAPSGQPSQYVHIECRGLVGQKITGQRKLFMWIRSYAGFQACKRGKLGKNPCIIAIFHTKEDAVTVSRAIHATTNFHCTYQPAANAPCPPTCKQQVPKVPLFAAPLAALPEQLPATKSTIPQPLNLAGRTEPTETATAETESGTMPVLCIRNLPAGTSHSAINSILSAFEGCVGFTVAVSGAVFARFANDACLERAALAFAAYRRLLGDASTAPARINISTEVTPSAKISHILSRLTVKPVQKGFLPIPRVPDDPVAFGTDFDPSPYFDGAVQNAVQTHASPELKEEFEELRAKVEKIKLGAVPLVKRKKQLETNLPIITYRHGGLEKGLASVAGEMEGKEEGEVVEVDREKVETLQKLVAGAIGAAAHVA